MRRRSEELGPDLFASASATQPVTAPAVPLIASPLVAETEAWLVGKTRTLGSLLASDRAVEYVAILRACADFRKRHEPEPLHEDLLQMVCGEEARPADETTFKNDLRQLKEWNLLAERIEKERLRGYRDNRRTKFRYRMCEDAAAFVDWLADRHVHELNPGGGDLTGNLLDLQCSLLHELRRKLRAIDPAAPDGDVAGDVLYRVGQMQVYIDATARTLQELNLRLLAFGADSFTVEEARPIVDELALFLERFGRRFGGLCAEILRDVEEMRRETQAKRWTACVETVRTEAAKFRHIASVAIPDPDVALADAATFYGPTGTLVELKARVTDSARKVWGKLNAKLRELERRNHRLEDLAARVKELVQLDEGEVPYAWMRALLEPAAMRGDAQVRPGGEKSIAPRPRASGQVRTHKAVTWITPRTVGEKADVASIAQVRAEKLKVWMAAHGLAVGPEGCLLSAAKVGEFADFPQIVQIIEQIRLGDGAKARRYLGITGQPLETPVTVRTRDLALTFDEIQLQRTDDSCRWIYGKKECTDLR